MTTIRTANGIKAEHLTGNYWLIRTDTTRFDVIKVAEGFEIGTVNFELCLEWLGEKQDPSFVPVANANRHYNRKLGKPAWHIADEGKFWDSIAVYTKDLKEILAVRAENHATASLRRDILQKVN